MVDGIPTSIRGTVWPLLLGNKANVTVTLYEQSKSEAFRVKQLSAEREAAEIPDVLKAGREDAVSSIEIVCDAEADAGIHSDNDIDNSTIDSNLNPMPMKDGEIDSDDRNQFGSPDVFENRDDTVDPEGFLSSVYLL